MSSTSVSTSSQLDAIQSMMESGQHSVRMERHTLIIWGLTAALLIHITDLIFSHELMPVTWHRVLSQTIFISVTLFLAGFWDFKLTRKVRRQRDESFSFIQLQVTKIWWFIVGLIVLINVGMNFFGGSYMFYGLTLALIGLAFYIHGLFSTQMLTWIGMMLILIGLGSVAFNLHFLATKWLAIGVFGLGLPILAFILDNPVTHSTLAKRLLLSFVWFAIVIIPSSIAYKHNMNFSPAGLTTRSLTEYNELTTEQAGLEQIINLPAGTEIPVQVSMGSEMLESIQTTAVTLKLTRPLDVVVNDGKVNGQFRLASDDWRKRMYHLRIKDFKMESSVTQEQGPSVNLGFRLEVK